MDLARTWHRFPPLSESEPEDARLLPLCAEFPPMFQRRRQRQFGSHRGKTTRIIWFPAMSRLVWNDARPLLKGTVPRIVEPSRKVTEPVGIAFAFPLGLTLAVKVTGCP
jgi:hypothetical protein